jgi:hypothetical protein
LENKRSKKQTKKGEKNLTMTRPKMHGREKKKKNVGTPQTLEEHGAERTNGHRAKQQRSNGPSGRDMEPNLPFKVPFQRKTEGPNKWGSISRHE